MVLAAGGVMASLRKVPEHVWQFALRQTTMTITIVDSNNLFECFRIWFEKQDHAAKIRRVDGFIYKSKPRVAPAPGSHWFLLEGRPIFVTFTRSEESKDNYSHKRSESFTIRLLGRDQSRLRSFLTNIKNTYDVVTQEEPRLYFYHDGWACAWDYKPRSLDSVILPGFEKEKLVADIEHFRAAEDRYNITGIPYHRGYLLYGLPGTGKTSLVAGLSSHFHSSIYLLSLSRITDHQLMSAVTSVPKSACLILEDVDCLVPENREETESQDGVTPTKKESKPGVTLSGLLNALDGLQTPPGLLFFLTTNYIEKLDPALIRPGRVDYRMEFGSATGEQKLELYKRLFPTHTVSQALNFLYPHDQKETMAQYQSRLLAIERVQ